MVLVRNGGRCYRHADYWNSWVVAVSFGNSCDFRYGIHPKESEKFIEVNEENFNNMKKAYKKEDIVVRVNSGDILIFNGNLLYHSVIKIYDELPKFWSQLDNINLNINRICLQFRDSRTIDNKKLNTKDPVTLNAINMENMQQMMNVINKN